jgi:predicted metalloprotease
VNRTAVRSIVLGLVWSLAVACAQPAGEDVVTGDGPGGDGGSSPAAPVDIGDPDDIAEAAVDDVTEFWRARYPEIYGSEFQDVAGFYPYGPDTEPPPCGSPPPRYVEIENNAFYCPTDDLIAWDREKLLPELNEQFGGFTVAIVIAHEFGHAVQARFGTNDRTVDLELQADCFAGAWTARVANGESARFSADDVDLDKTVAGLIAIRDPVGATSADDPFAHGSGFDRVAAFQDGFQNDAAKCAEYANESEDRRTVELEFTDDDLGTGGNFPLYDEDAPEGRGLFTLVEADLNEFYEWYFDQLGATWTPVADLVLVDPATDEVTCGGEQLSGSDLARAALYCEDENIVVLDDGELVPTLNEIGDFAVGSEVAQLWAVAAQSQLAGEETDEADLQAICLSGFWSASLVPGVEDVTPGSTLGISAGDLDEAIIAFIAYGQAEGGRTVFDRAAALRTGFFGDVRACEEYGPLG